MYLLDLGEYKERQISELAVSLPWSSSPKHASTVEHWNVDNLNVFTPIQIFSKSD